VHRDTVAVAIPWWLIILVVVGGAIYLYLRVRRRIDTKRADEWVAHMEAEARRKLETDDKGELVSSGAPADGDPR